jgi:hypothetical protein
MQLRIEHIQKWMKSFSLIEIEFVGSVVNGSLRTLVYV